MHRSRLGSIGIDCDDLTMAARFWSAALGLEIGEANERYVDLQGDAVGLRIFLQKVPEPKTSKTRMHLDIESDNVAAEVTRLEGLGALTVDRIGTWCVMQDPAGNEFCVVEPETPSFPERTRLWDV